MKSIEIDQLGRFYQDPIKLLWYPSVTTVVGYRDRQFFEDWRRDPLNLAKSQRAIDRGNKTHKLIEQWLQTNPRPKLQDPEYLSLSPMVKNLAKITSIRAQETPVFSSQLRLAGRIDCVGYYDNKCTIIDFKTASRTKMESEIRSYMEQATAYGLMWSESHPDQPIEQICIMMLCGSYQCLTFARPIGRYQESLEETIADYWLHHDFDHIQQACNSKVSECSET